MPLPPNQQLLSVFSHPWVKGITYKDKGGKSVKVTRYQQARDYAESHGYIGIKINPRRS